MSYVYRVIRAWDDIVGFECLDQESTFFSGGGFRGNEFVVTRKNGFYEMITTEEPYDDHWVALLSYFAQDDATVRIGKF